MKGKKEKMQNGTKLGRVKMKPFNDQVMKIPVSLNSSLEEQPLIASQTQNQKEEKHTFPVKLLLTIFTLLLITASIPSRSFSLERTRQFILASENYLVLQIENEYPSLASLSFYPWQYIVEPYRDTTLRITNSNSDAIYIWNVLDSSNNKVLENYTGSEVSLVFSRAGDFYTVKVDEIGGELRSLQEQVICKYVRREIQDLTETDRQKYLNALKIFHTISQEEGQRLYGKDFFNYKELTRLHLQEEELASSEGSSTCSPWHTGPNFISTHLALVLWVEQNLQLIDPTIAIPYWDYVADSLLYGTEWSVKSPIFTDEYFGSYNQYPFELTGLWDKTPLATVTEEYDKDSRHNSYNVLTDWYNNNPSTTVQRSNEACGWKFEQIGLPSCAEVNVVLQKESLNSVKNVLEFGLHGRLHIMIGGVWECGPDFGQLKDELDGDSKAQLIVEGILGMAASMNSKFYSSSLYTNPGVCSSDTEFSECRFTCMDLTFEDIENLTDEEVYEYLDSNGLFSMYDFNQKYTASLDGTLRYKRSTDGSGTYVFRYVDTETDSKLKRYMLKLACGPGKMSPFTSPLAATNDPIFVSSHSYHQLHWSYLQLSNPDFDYLYWYEDTDCYGHRLDDVLPWSGFLGEEKDQRYTNGDLLKLFHPTNPDLPYIHDSFDRVEQCTKAKI